MREIKLFLKLMHFEINIKLKVSITFALEF